MYSIDCIDKLGMTLSMKLMSMCGCSGFEKILLNPKSEVRGMYFGTGCSFLGFGIWGEPSVEPSIEQELCQWMLIR